MKNIWKNYKLTILLLCSLVVGAIVGLVFGDKATVLSPFGDLFMNMMFVLIVPLIFLTITTSVAKIKQPKRLGSVFKSIVVVIAATSIFAVLVGIISTYAVKLINPKDSNAILEILDNGEEGEKVELDLLSRTVQAISVDDFSKILSRENLLALVLVAVFTGIAINKIGKEAEPVENFLNSANKVVLKLVDMAFYYAPIGLGCYFASLIGTFGASIAVGYLKTFIVYTVVALIYYFGVYSLYAYIAAGKKGVSTFWKNIWPATVTSISTCSSAASIPVNIQCSKNMGVSDDIAETIVPLGSSFHKDGSIIGSVFKIMFLAYLFGTNVYSFGGITKIFGVALIATLLVAAVPVGGGTISEALIISMMGFPMTALPILTIIATIIDAPATLLNVVGDSADSMLVAKMVDGKNWINKKIAKN